MDAGNAGTRGRMLHQSPAMKPGFFVFGFPSLSESAQGICMADKPTCLVCEKEMEPGFLTDLGDANTIHLPRWCPGEPQPSFWAGEAKRSQLNEGFKVSAFRCPQCHALRLYAHS